MKTCWIKLKGRFHFSPFPKRVLSFSYSQALTYLYFAYFSEKFIENLEEGQTALGDTQLILLPVKRKLKPQAEKDLRSWSQ